MAKKIIVLESIWFTMMASLYIYGGKFAAHFMPLNAEKNAVELRGLLCFSTYLLISLFPWFVYFRKWGTDT